MALLAGASTIDITPAHPVQMDGYGGRSIPFEGVHDPIFARALVLDDGDSACAIIGCDLLGIHPQITAEIRERISKETGIAAEAILLAATHSHAGPYGLRSGMFGQLNQPLADALVDSVVGAVVSAYQDRQPATLKLGQATVDTVSMNRRHPDWPIDPALQLLLIDGERGPIATLLNFACHATIMDGKNLQLSAEFPGAACRLVQEQTGAPAVYLNGACGNVNPVWIKQDFENVERVGQIIGGQALRTIGELRTLGVGQRVHNIRWDEFPEKPVPGRIIEPSIHAVTRKIELPHRQFAGDSDYAERIASLKSDVDSTTDSSDERRAVMAQLSRTETERWAALWARQQNNPSTLSTEIQALRLGDGLAVIALPGEFFVETATAIRSGVAKTAAATPSAVAKTAAAPLSAVAQGPSPENRFDDLLVACYANDYVGYVIPEDAYAAGGYESGVTFCTENAERIIADAAISLLADL